MRKDLSKLVLEISGSKFEELCCDLVSELGFINLRRQASGTQFGYDIAADHQTDLGLEHWVFECKKYSSRVPLKEVSNKLLWVDTQRDLACFVLISNADLANDHYQLLISQDRAYDVLTWTGEVFIRLLTACRRTYRKWFPGCRRSHAVNPKRFLAEERSKFEHEPTLCDLVTRADLTFRVKIKMRKGFEGSRIVLTDPRGRRVADLSFEGDSEIELRLTSDLKGKHIRIWYDLLPMASSSGPTMGDDEIVLSGRRFVLPSSQALKDYEREGQKYYQELRSKFSSKRKR